MKGLLTAGAVSALLAGAAIGAQAKKPIAKQAATPTSITGPVGIAIASARRAYVRARVDKFAAGAATPAVEGQAFRVELPLHDGDKLGNDDRISGFWTYAKGKLRVIYSAEEYVGRIELGHSNEHLADIGGRKSLGAPWVGENAFGAKRRVSVEFWNVDAIAFRAFPTPDEKSPYDEDRPAILGPLSLPAEQRSYWVDVPVSGSAARQLAQNVRVVIEGKIAKLANGDLTECHEHYFEPKVDEPYEITELTCWVGAEISRVAFIDKSNGAVLKEWTGANGLVRPDVH